MQRQDDKECANIDKDGLHLGSRNRLAIYSSGSGSSKPTVTKCAAGKKFVPAESGTPSKCETCPEGTFNANDDASVVCAKHNACADSGVKDKGTTSTDAVCNPGIYRHTRAKDKTHTHTHTHTHYHMLCLRVSHKVRSGQEICPCQK